MIYWCKITIFQVLIQKNNPLKSQRVINKTTYFLVFLLFSGKLIGQMVQKTKIGS